MELTGYYMTAVTKFADGIKTIIVFGVRTREELVKALNAAHPDELADRLGIPQVDEVL